MSNRISAEVTLDGRSGHRQRKAKGAAPTGPSAFSPNLPTMRFDQVLDNGQANAAATPNPAAGLVHPVKAAEQVGQVFGRDANPAVANGEQQFSILDFGF